ncbi:hypothetical protein [Thermodesulfovibrio hydrogeniphilus]
MKSEYLGKEFYSNVRWFEPDADKIRKMRFGIVIACIMLSFAILFTFTVLYYENLQPEDKLLIGIFSPIWILYIAQLINTYKIMENRLGFDGEMVYLRDYNGKIWKGKPSELVYSGKLLAGGNIFIIYIKDKHFNPFYPPEIMREIDRILSKAVKMNPLKFELSYVIKHGNLTTRLFMLYLSFALISGTVVLLLKHFAK